MRTVEGLKSVFGIYLKKNIKNTRRHSETEYLRQRVIITVYYMAQVTSGKTARCDWLLTWQDFSVKTAGIMKIVKPCEQKRTQSPKSEVIRATNCCNLQRNIVALQVEKRCWPYYHPPQTLSRNKICCCKLKKFVEKK